MWNEVKWSDANPSEVKWCEAKRSEVNWREVKIFRELCVLSSIDSYVAVCRCCAVHCLIIIYMVYTHRHTHTHTHTHTLPKFIQFQPTYLPAFLPTYTYISVHKYVTYVHVNTYLRTSRKVAASIPDGVIGIFHWHNSSDYTMALGSTQSLTEMSTRNVSWVAKAAGA
jgi:hypothetical protein